MNTLLMLLLACATKSTTLPGMQGTDTGPDGLEVIPYCQLLVQLEDAEDAEPVVDATMALYANGALFDEAVSKADGEGTLYLGEDLLDADLFVEIIHTDYRELTLTDDALATWRGDHSERLELWLEPLR